MTYALNLGVLGKGLQDDLAVGVTQFAFTQGQRLEPWAKGDALGQHGGVQLRHPLICPFKGHATVFQPTYRCQPSSCSSLGVIVPIVDVKVRQASQVLKEEARVQMRGIFRVLLTDLVHT